MTRDVVLLTVDSWRYDTKELVPNLSSRLSRSANLICAGAATNWTFPAILSGTYYPDAYDGDGGLRSDLTSLPEVLSEAGYATGGFVACNPYVSKWNDHFDEFWNADLSSETAEWYSSSIEKWVSRLYRTALLKKRVSAGEVARRASRWYVKQDQPRFLWVHLMEPHLPYYPGLQKARNVGLIDTYQSVIEYQRRGDDMRPEHAATQRSLYDKCVERFDEQVPDLLKFVSDEAIVLALGDHGEEFDHGHYDHERLYDECVRVPCYFDNLPNGEIPDPVRQIDLAPWLLSELGLSIPTKWNGQPARSLQEQPALMITPEPGENLLHVGIRSESAKLIRSFDQDTGQLHSTEYYDLTTDPAEMTNLAGSTRYDDLSEQLGRFVSEHAQAFEIDASTGFDSETVESRLEDLGYK